MNRLFLLASTPGCGIVLFNTPRPCESQAIVVDETTGEMDFTHFEQSCRQPDWPTAAVYSRLGLSDAGVETACADAGEALYTVRELSEGDWAVTPFADDPGGEVEWEGDWFEEGEWVHASYRFETRTGSISESSWQVLFQWEVPNSTLNRRFCTDQG